MDERIWIVIAAYFWTSEAVNEFIDNRWSFAFFIDAFNAAIFIGFLIGKAFTS